MTDNQPRNAEILYKARRTAGVMVFVLMGILLIGGSLILGDFERLGRPGWIVFFAMYCLWALIGLADCLLFYVRFSDQGIVCRNWWGRTRSYTYDQVARFDEPLLRGGVKIIFADGKETSLGGSHGDPIQKILHKYSPHAMKSTSLSITP